MREVWIVKGKVTNPSAYHDVGLREVKEGDTEWQFSDGPTMQRCGSSDYVSLEEGLKAHSGYVIYWDSNND